MLSTRFTKMVGCSVPIQQAGLGAPANKKLAAAVANAGAQGMISWSHMPVGKLIENLDDLCVQTTGVFGVNFLVHHYENEANEIHACVREAAARAKVIDFFYHDPIPALIELVHQQEALVCWQVGSRAEAVAAVDAGCDFIIAQGIEAGGHVRGTIGLMALLNEVLQVVEVPVLAAGGIGTGRNMAAALAAGADGVRVGTRFVATHESGAHPQYVEALIKAEARDTVYTDVFSYNWSDAPHRVLRSCVEAAQAYPEEIIGEQVSLRTGTRVPVHRFESFDIMMDTTGAIEAMPQFAGESVTGVTKQQSAAEVIQELSDEAEKFLKSWG